MAKKKAFVFDTNFIIQNPKLDEVIEKLKDDYVVYISQVSIDERIAQQCRKLREEFDEIEKCKSKYSRYAKITLITSYEKQSNAHRIAIQEKYFFYFQDRIIPFRKSEEIFEMIIDRANKKDPPFSCNKDASDKGFKDCLLWLSLLDYFKENGEDEIVFLTDDKNAFRNYTDFLTKEFQAKTGKVIVFKPNSYYKELFEKNDIAPQMDEPKKETVFNIDEFRTEIEEVIESLRGIDDEDQFGDPQWLRTFTSSIPFDKEYVKTIFTGLRSDIFSHIFEKSVPATKVFDLDGRVIDGDAEVPIKNLENALKIYQRVLGEYSQYSEQFFEAAAKILNRNYVAPKYNSMSGDDDLPF